jgi:thioredoxin
MAATTFDAPIHTTDQNIERVLKAGLPVALVFANGPTPLDDALKQVAREQAGKLLVVKVNAAENPASVRRFDVGALPALVTVRDGQALTSADAVTRAELMPHLDYLLGKGPRPRLKATAEAPRPTATSSGAGGKPIIVTDATFEAEVLRAREPVLIDFWAPWCGPCKMVAPTVEKLAGEMAGRLRVAKVNTDENPGLSQRYDIQGIPTMMIFRGGQLVTRWTGAAPEPAIRQRVREAVGVS